MLNINNVSYTYPECEGPALSNIHLSINKGEMIVLCGQSGSGKSTLIQCLNGIIPHFSEGTLMGDIFIKGNNTRKLELYDIAKLTGTVFQNPKTQFFNVDTDSELVFTVENLGYPKDEMVRRTDRIMNTFRANHLKNKNLFQLSGGQKQLVAALSVAIHEPSVILLDEPSSNLDAKTIEDLKKIIHYWKSIGITIVIAEHRLYYLLDDADRFIYMKNGTVSHEFSKTELMAMDDSSYKKLGLRQRYTPLLEYQADNQQIKKTFITGQYKKQTEHFDFNIPALSLPSPSVYGIIGPNGAGKSTWIKHLIGLEDKRRAYFSINENKHKKRQCVRASTLVMQDVNHQLFTESVEQEVILSMDKQNRRQPEYYLDLVQLTRYKDRHPMSLSGGEKQRLAIATAMASDKHVYVFDEPTSGLDLKNMERVAQLLNSLRDMGKQVFLITHDIELLKKCADGVIKLENGHLKGIYHINRKTNHISHSK